MSTYARNNIRNNILNVKILEYNRKNIKSDYIGQFHSDIHSDILSDNVMISLCIYTFSKKYFL